MNLLDRIFAASFNRRMKKRNITLKSGALYILVGNSRLVVVDADEYSIRIHDWSGSTLNRQLVEIKL